MIYDYLTFDFTKNAENIYTFPLKSSFFSDSQLGKNIKMSVCQFQVKHDNNIIIEERNPVSLVLLEPTIRNLGLKRVICLEGGFIKSPVFRLDTQPKTFVFSIDDMFGDTTWTHATVIIEISYEEKEDYFKDAIMKKM